MLSYSDIPGFSKIFSELCSDSDIASQVFSSNKKLEDINWRNAIINKQQYADYTVEIIRKTMHHVELTELQQHNLLLLEQKKQGSSLPDNKSAFWVGLYIQFLKHVLQSLRLLSILKMHARLFLCFGLKIMIMMLWRLDL